MALLCATNFSAESTAAATAAAELARARGESLWLIFVVPHNAAGAYGEEVLATADQKLQAEASRLRAFGVTVTPAVLIGRLHQELPRFAQENDVSLVIAGDAASPSGNGLLGRLGRVLTTPLLAVRDPAPLIAWARGKRPLKLVIGVDTTRSTAIAARWVQQLAKVGPIELVGAHVYFPAAETHRFGLPLPRQWDDAQPELIASLQRELHRVLPADLPHRLVLRPALGRVSDHLCAIAEEEKADLLVFGTHHRQALGRMFSVSEQCLPRAAMSVACVPATARDVRAEPGIAEADRVLIATDFSPTGDRAISWGLGVLAAGGTADLVHVSAEPLTAEAEKKITDQLRARIPPEAQARGLTVHVHALAGNHAAQAIVAAAERFASAVICLGSRTRDSLDQAIFGSTARGVFEASRRPVLVVRPPEA